MCLAEIRFFHYFRPELAGDLTEKCPILVEPPVFIGLVVSFGGGIVEVCITVIQTKLHSSRTGFENA